MKSKKQESRERGRYIKILQIITNENYDSLLSYEVNFMSLKKGYY